MLNLSLLLVFLVLLRTIYGIYRRNWAWILSGYTILMVFAVYYFLMIKEVIL